MNFDLQFNDGTLKQASVAEISDLLKNGHMGAILVRKFFINEHVFDYFPILSLTIGNESIPFEENGFVILPTFFPHEMIPGYLGEKINARINCEDIITFAVDVFNKEA